MTARELSYRVDAALKFLQRLRPGGPWLLLSISVDQGRTIAQSCTTPEEVENFIQRDNVAREGRGARGIYYSVNPTSAAIDKKPTKRDIDAVEYLHVDADPDKDETVDAFKQRMLPLIAAYERKPTFIIDSGNGLHLLWRLREPVALFDDGGIADVEARNFALAQTFGADPSTRNVDRILRLPGTINWPNEKKTKQGRKPALATLLEANDAAYDLDAFRKAAVTIQQKAHATMTTFETFEKIAPDDPRLGKLRKKWVRLAFEGKGIADDRSRSVLAFACECVRVGIADAVIASMLMTWEIGAHIREQGNVARALSRTIARAHEFIADSDLFKMNEQHAVLPIGGKTRVATWGDDPEFSGYRTITRFSSFSDFTALHDKYEIKYTITDAKGHKKIVVTEGRGTWWINNSGRRQYDNGMKFMPTADADIVNDTLNLWQGFRVVARKPDGKSGERGCKRFLDHGLKIVCGGNEEHFDYLMKREAFIAQQRTRSEIAVALHTEEEGTGKGFWCRGLNHLYGIHAMEVQKPEHVTGKHNKHLEVLLRLTADEALFARDPRHRNALYSLITEPTNTIEPKFVDVYSAPNYANVDIISNAKHFIPVGGTARRFFVPSMSPDRANDHDYFRKIQDELDDGGYEALLYHLLFEIDISDFNVRDVPKTHALAEQAAYSRNGVELLVETACNEARVPSQHTRWPGFSDCSGYGERHGFDYLVDHHVDHELSRLGALAVKRRLKMEWGCQTGKATRRQFGRHQTHGILWPPLLELRARFEAKFGKQRWLRPLLTEWQG
jgi:hypothetical protein